MVGIKDLRLRPEIEELRIEPAIDFSSVVAGEVRDSYLLDPVEFFKRTHLTPNMRRLVIKSLMALIGLREAKLREKYMLTSNLILLPTEMGGGKTHSLALLYHIVALIRDSPKDKVLQALRILDGEIAKFVEDHWDELKSIPLRTVVVDCTKTQFAPSPIEPFKSPMGTIYTIWGFIAYQLNRYELIKEADRRQKAPFVDVLARVLSNTGALILIDEIGRYYTESDLEPSTISNFLMNLADAASKYSLGKTAIVISLPTEESEYIHAKGAIEAVRSVLGREDLERIVPVSGGDLPDILRKRIFEDENWEKLVEEYIEDLLRSDLPEDVERVIRNTDFIMKLRKTYPFHPGYVEILEKLIYELKYLQRTRDALRIAVRSVHAIINGRFDFLDESPKLIMPYHVPIFSVEFLNDTVLKNAPSEYKAMELALKTNVVRPLASREIEKISPAEFIEKVFADPLRELGKQSKTGFKLGVVIWLHSLMGHGLPSNLGLYPRTLDLIRFLSPTSEDVRGTLLRMSDSLPQLLVHGEVEEDSSRWFFSNIPSIEELLASMKERVTMHEAEARLARLFEEGMQPGRRGRKPKTQIREKIIEYVKVVRNPGDIPDEILYSEKPSLIVFVRPLRAEELASVLCGRNYLITLIPFLQNSEEVQLLREEDAKLVKELRSLIGRTQWDALIEILRYLVATESISEENLKMFVGEELGREESRDLLIVLKSKIENKKGFYNRYAWRFIKSIFNKVYYCRGGRIIHDEGLVLDRDRPLAELVQEFLINIGRIETVLTHEDILNYHEKALGLDREGDDISVEAIWRYLATTDKVNVPIVPFSALIEGFKRLIQSMDYIVVIDGVFLWKKVYESKERALRADQGMDLVNAVVETIKKRRTDWRNLKLVFWRRGLEGWLNDLKKSLSEDEEIVLVDRAGNEYLLEDLSPEMETVIKVGGFFKRKREFRLNVSIEPNEVRENSEVEVSGKVEVKGYSGRILVETTPFGDLRIVPERWSGENPVALNFRLFAGGPGDAGIRFTIRLDGKVLERAIPIRVIGTARVLEDKLSSSIPDESVVLEARIQDLAALLEVKRMLDGLEGVAEGVVEIMLDNDKLTLNFNTTRADVIQFLYTPLRQLINAGGRARVNVRFRPRGPVSVGDLRSLVINKNKIVVKARVR